jgi:chromate transporter
MIYFELFFEFFKIGLFAVGGGMATLPFLRHLSATTGWFSEAFIVDMIAISESTPGPIGINMATYAGYNVAGVLGGVVATLGEVMPSIIIVVVVSTYLAKYSKSPVIEQAFSGLRPAVTGLIAAAGHSIIKLSILQIETYNLSGEWTDLFEWKKLIYFGVIFFLIRRFKRHPITYIAASAVIGIIMGF